MKIYADEIKAMVERVDAKLAPLCDYEGFKPYEGIYRLGDWVDENGVGDLLDIDELDNDMVSADYEDGSHVKRNWAK